MLNQPMLRSATMSSNTHVQLRSLLLVRLLLTARQCGPRLQVQSLEQRSSPSRLALQAPIPTHQMHEILLVSHLYPGNVMQNTVDDDFRDERRTRFVRLVVCARALARFRGLVETVYVVPLVRFGVECRLADLQLLKLTIHSCISCDPQEWSKPNILNAYWQMLLTIACEDRSFRALSGFHRHEELFLPGTRRVKRGEA